MKILLSIAAVLCMIHASEALSVYCQVSWPEAKAQLSQESYELALAKTTYIACASAAKIKGTNASLCDPPLQSAYAEYYAALNFYIQVKRACAV